MLLLEDLSIIDLPNFVKRCYYVTIPFIILRYKETTRSYTDSLCHILWDNIFANNSIK